MYHPIVSCTGDGGSVGDGLSKGTCSDGLFCMASGLCRGKSGYVWMVIILIYILTHSYLTIFIQMQHAQEMVERPETSCHKGLVTLEKPVHLMVPV